MIPFHLLPFSNNYQTEVFAVKTLYSFPIGLQYLTFILLIFAVNSYVVNTYIKAYYVVPVFLYQSQSQY